jgi:hypothetical protein
MKVIVFVHTCKKYEECRAKLIEATWGAHEDVVFITDNSTSTLKQHIYIGEYMEGPTYHPENVIKMFNLFINNYSHYDFFMIIDDDAYLYIDKLKLFLSFFEKTTAYMIGNFLNWTDPNPEDHIRCDYNWWVGGGAGIVFTKKCIEKFLHLTQTIYLPYANHDVWLHWLFMNSDKRIKRVDCPAFHQTGSSELIKIYPKDSNNIVSIHLQGEMSRLIDYHVTQLNELS